MRLTGPFALGTTSVVATVTSVLLLTTVALQAESAKRSTVSALAAGEATLDEPTAYVLDEWNSKG